MINVNLIRSNFSVIFCKIYESVYEKMLKVIKQVKTNLTEIVSQTVSHGSQFYILRTYEKMFFGIFDSEGEKEENNKIITLIKHL